MNTHTMPAVVTPFDKAGKVDLATLAKLLIGYGHVGCTGVVLAGTNGEGPSLSNYEKRDLVETAAIQRPFPEFQVVLGITTSSLPEAKWLCRACGNSGGNAVLLMPPTYFPATEEGMFRWFWEVLEASPVPILVYNFPQRSGISFTPDLLGRLSGHPMFLGVKDSSGQAENLPTFRHVLSPNHWLLVGDETLLLPALELGWNGTISGASNVVADWVSHVAQTQDAVKFEILVPVLKAIRSKAQPGHHKALMHRWGSLSSPDLRLPLLPPEPNSVQELEDLIVGALGPRF